MRIGLPRFVLGRAVATVRAAVRRLFRAPSPPPRQADIEHALLRALGGI